MRIILNGTPCETSTQRLDQMLIEQGYTSPTIATAVNSTFVHKHKRDTITLAEGDQVEIVAPIEGG